MVLGSARSERTGADRARPFLLGGGEPLFQVKSWRHRAELAGAIDQLVCARTSHERDGYPVRGAYLITMCDTESPAFAERRAAETIQHIGRRRLLALMREYLVFQEG